MRINELPIKLKKYGFEYMLLAAEQGKALYSQHLEGKTIGYEVFMLKEKTQFSSHSYPKHEDFGTKAWTFRSEETAFDFYNRLVPPITAQTSLPF